MTQAELEDKLKRRLKPLYLKHLAHAIHQRQYEATSGLVDPDKTRMEEACLKEAQNFLNPQQIDIVTVKFQADQQLLVQGAAGEAENLKVNFLINRTS